MQPTNMMIIYNEDKKLKKRLHGLEGDKIQKKSKHWFDVSRSDDYFFVQDDFLMTAFVFVSVIESVSY